MKTFLAAAVLSLSLSVPAFAEEQAAPDLWKAKCKSCHGETGKGDTKVGKKEKISDMTTPEYHSAHTYEDLRLVIAEGSKDNTKMKPFKDKLTPTEIDGLVKHIRRMKK